MSISDPLLKALKKYIIELCVVGSSDNPVITKEEISDDNAALEHLCEVIEDILRKGLYRVGGLLSLEHRDYWCWFYELPKLLKQQEDNNDSLSHKYKMHHRYGDCLDIVKKYSDKVETIQGKGRLMIRALLHNKILYWAIECLCFTLNAVPRYYSDFNSLLSNEILSQMLISQLKQLSVLNFNLNLKNAMFLNDSWTIPRYETHEFVPCKQLGVTLLSAEAYQIVEAIKKGSVAEEEKYFQSGDVLDELFGYSLKWFKLPLKDIMKSNENKPVRLSIVKLRLKDGTLFPPILKLLRKYDLIHMIEPREMNLSIPANTALPIHARPNDTFPDDVPASNPNMAPHYGLRYVGSTYVGSYGGVSKIESSIAETLKHYNDPSTYVPIYIELGEKDILIHRASSKQNEDINDEASRTDPQTLPILFAHAYPQISSCGRRIDCSRFLAYIVGESTCTISKHFVCHVFEARTETESKAILCSIAQGFERTHWAI